MLIHSTNLLKNYLAENTRPPVQLWRAAVLTCSPLINTGKYKQRLLVALSGHTVVARTAMSEKRTLTAARLPLDVRN